MLGGTRRTVSVALVAILLGGAVVGVMLDMAGRDDFGLAVNATDGKAAVWLQLRYGGGGGFGLSETLTVDTEGMATVQLQTSRENGYIGTFQLRLTEERLAELRKALRRAASGPLRRGYPAPGKNEDTTWVEITLQTTSGRRDIRATSRMWVYPSGLKRLFDLNRQRPTGGPTGVLSDLISEVSAHPIAAVGLQLGVPKHTFRTGDTIPVTVNVKNVGTEPVAVPSLECREIVYGSVWVQLRHDPITVEEALGANVASLTFGPSQGASSAEFGDAAKADLAKVVRIEPGQAWKLPVPLCIRATSAGRYELAGVYNVEKLYPDSVLEKALGMRLVTGMTDAFPSAITIE